MNVLAVENLSIAFQNALTKQWEKVANQVSFTLDTHIKKLAIVGESGAGKTMIGKAIIGLLPATARIEADRFEFMGHDLLTLPTKKWQKIRGRAIGLILQDPKYALNPNMKVGLQIEEMYQYHLKLCKKEAQEATLNSLAHVKITNPRQVYKSYPHEISGGMGQCAMIAMMLAARPKLLIADEPTSALDQENKAQFLNLMRRCIDQYDMSLLLISHDLTMAKNFCEHILMLYKGQVVTLCATSDLAKNKHPYVQGLLNCVPKLNKTLDRLPTIDRALL